MKVRFGLRIKFFLLFLGFMAVLAGAIIYVTKNSYEDTIIDKYYDHAVSIAKLSASVLNGEQIKEYVENGNEVEGYQEDLARLDNIKKETGVYYLYVMYPYTQEEGIYVFDATLTKEQMELVGSGASTLGDEVCFGENFPSAMEVMKTGKPSSALDITTTQQGDIVQTLASAYAPIFDSENRVIAFVGVDVNMTDVETYVQNASVEIIKYILYITIVCFAVLLFIVQISILSPIKKLNLAAENLANGKYDERIIVSGRDEISATTTVFNRMSENIKGHVNEINSINAAYHKYVPSQFFNLLKKERVTEVKLGNQKQQELSVLDFNIVGFEQQIRKMNSEEMFAYINSNLQEVLPEVAEQEGMVEDFHEGGFTALYLNQCEKALDSAISISQRIHKMNQKNLENGKASIEFGMGIAYGAVMVGIVGHDSRMAAISISHQTEIARFLQKLAPKYYSSILITGTAAAQIPKFFEQYHARVIGYVWNTFLGQIEKVYDVYDGDKEEDKRKKDNTKEIFEKGVNLYCAKQFYEARNCFIEVLKQFRRDSAAREYLFLCNQYYQMDNVADIEIYIEKF